MPLHGGTGRRGHRAVMTHLEHQDEGDAHRGEKTHDRGDRVTLLLAVDHAPKGARQRKRDQEHQEDFEAVRPPARILERMCRLGVVEAAAVAGDQLDGFLAGDRSAGDGLLGTVQRGDDLVVQVEILDYAAGQQHDRAGQEALHRDAGHLHQVARRRLTPIGLPAGVGHKADRGVPRQRRRHLGRRVMQVQRQLVLEQFEEEQDQNADRRERQNAAGICAPSPFGFRVDADDAINGLLDFQVSRRRIDPVHVVTQRRMHRRQRRHKQNEECDSRDCATQLRPLGKSKAAIR
jgi:hypothetical protein